MILINKKESVPIVHICRPERVDEVMTEKEIHEFGLDRLLYT